MASFDRAIPPGGAGKISLKVQTAGYQGMITKTALVESNDPHHRSMTLSLSAKVRAYVMVEPAGTIILRGVVGEDVRQVLHIHAGDNYPLKVGGIKTDLAQWIHCKLIPQKGGHAYDLEVTGKSSTRGSYTGYVRLLTNHPKKPEITLPVYFRVAPALEAWPTAIAFGRVPKTPSMSELAKRAVTIVDNRRKGIHLEKLSYNKDYFTVKVHALTAPPVTRYRLEVVPRLDMLPRGTVSDTLIVQTDEKGAAELRIPLTIQVE